MTAQVRSIAVLGTGIMGAPMARNLASAGFEVRVWNRTREKADALADVARVHAQPTDAVNGADAVLTMLADGGAVRSLMEGGGVLAAMAPGTLWLQCSTIALADTEELVRKAAEAKVSYVDAPVLGTKEPAERGELVVMASGEDASLDRVQPVFDAIGKKLLRLGKAGEGTRTKLVVNHWLLALVENLAETVAFAESLGVDPRRFLQIIDGAAIGAPYAQLKGKAMLDRTFPPSFPLRLAKKDLALVLAAARGVGHRAPLAEAAQSQYQRALDLGHGEEDMAAVYWASTT